MSDQLSMPFDPTPDPQPAEPPAATPVAAGPATLALPREMILASAGSGKTFRISSRIIGLLAHGEPPDAILASTFTRKAAGEILGRVLLRLAEAALDPAKARELAEHAALDGAAQGRVTGGTAAGPAPTGNAPAFTALATGTLATGTLDCDRCLELLARLARRMHRLNIGTLDSFFIRAAQTFAHEVGLPPAWGIADEPVSRRVRAEALQEVLRRGDPATTVELVRLANRGEVARSVHEGLLRRLDVLHAIHHQLDPSVAEPWSIYPGLDREEAAGAAAGGAGAAVTAGGAESPGDAGALRLAEAIEALEPPLTRAGTPNRTWEGALAKATAAIRAGDWEAFIAGTLTQKILAGESEFARAAIPDDVSLLFQEALETACRVIGRRLNAQAGAMGRLVALFDEALVEAQRREGAYRFDDVTRLLGGPTAPGARPDLHYRLDARLRHLLLDEFQDTSVPQWSALRPVADTLLADGDGGRAAIIVADPKQSIYGWRGAEPGLVYRVGERYALERDVLARSWRSSQVVLDAVNQVFAGIAETPALDEQDRAVAADWARAFTPHEAAKSLPGHVHITIGPADTGRGNHRPRLLARAAALVRTLHEAKPGAGIGVLTRENRAVARVIHELRRLGVDASEEGGNPLTDSAAVASVLALLRLADHPGDRIARYHVARTPVGEAVGYTEPADERGARRLAHHVRERLLRNGYGATLDRWAGALEPACDAREARRLRQLVELAFRFDDRATLRPTDFVRWVEVERVEDPTAAGVRVMTVHQSKGLEFDVVVLPELDTSIFRGGGVEALPYREDPAGPVTRVFPYVGQAIRPLFPEIEAAYRQSRAAGLRDALSMLYVAMTRARHALHLVLKPDGENGPGTATTPALIVRAALAPDQTATENDDAFYSLGDADWHRSVPRVARASPAAGGSVGGGTETAGAASTGAAAPTGKTGPTAPAAPGTPTEPARMAPPPAPATILRAAPHRLRMLPRRTPSGLEGGGRVDLAQRLRLEGRGGRERGSVAHAWCQEIGWIEDGLPDDERLRRIARGVAPGLPAAEIDALLERFHGWIEQPAVRGALTRDAYPAGARFERELPFLHRSGDAIVEGIVDRLVLWPADGPVAGAEVLDYKTDAVDADDTGALAGRIEFYRPQLEAYRAAIADLYRLDPTVIGARLVFLHAGVVRGV